MMFILAMTGLSIYVIGVLFFGLLSFALMCNSQSKAPMLGSALLLTLGWPIIVGWHLVLDVRDRVFHRDEWV